LSGPRAVKAEIFTIQKIGRVKIVNYKPRDGIVVVEATKLIERALFAGHRAYRDRCS
jgi:hypothetical protein